MEICGFSRLPKYIYLRDKFAQLCVDLEPRRKIEIDSILENDDGSAKEFTKEEWIDYFGTFGSYVLPFDTEEKQREILHEVLTDVNRLEGKLGIACTPCAVLEEKEAIKAEIAQLRAYRNKLQNLEIKLDYGNDSSKIDEAIDSLLNIRKLGLKPSIALEKWVNVALNIMDDAKLIKPNSIVGDDNEPTFTAPAGAPDIECYYEEFNAICEVTMLSGRDQWYTEGQPVMRHLRDFENRNPSKPCYCLFVAPSLHADTVNTHPHKRQVRIRGQKATDRATYDKAACASALHSCRRKSFRERVHAL